MHFRNPFKTSGNTSSTRNAFRQDNPSSPTGAPDNPTNLPPPPSTPTSPRGPSEGTNKRRLLEAGNYETRAETAPNISAEQFNAIVSHNSRQGEQIDWQAGIVINPAHIAALGQKIEENYRLVPAEKIWMPATYPKEDLTWAYLSNSKGSSVFNEQRNQRYNPFQLRLPYQLKGGENLYDHTRIERNPSPYGSYGRLTGEKASSTYFNFIKQYNLAYISFLKAVNGSEEDIARLKELFGKNSPMFTAAEVETTYLNKEIKNNQQGFLHALLGYLCLDIVRSTDPEISTAARARALTIVKDHFDADKIAEALAGYPFNMGLKLPYNTKDEPVFDLIPRRFATRPEEQGGTPHNDLFLKNERIQELFPPANNDPYNPSLALDAGFSTLLSKHTEETVQVLLSLLRMDSSKVDNKLVFHMLVNLSDLDGIQKGQLFGSKASFRNGGASSSGLQERAAGISGTGESFGDYLDENALNQLSPEQLKARIRQMAYQQHLLETRVVELEGAGAARFTNKNNDPKGYFLTLQMHPNTPSKDFDEVLKRNHRALALKYHPDKTNDEEEKKKNVIMFRKIQEAYEFLSDKENRRTYGK